MFFWEFFGMDAIRTIIFFIPLIFHCEYAYGFSINTTEGNSTKAGHGSDNMQGNIQFDIVVWHFENSANLL